jgi:hypothetical protein
MCGRLLANADISKVMQNSCAMGKEECLNCHKHFMALRPLLTGGAGTKRFVRDLKDEAKANLVVAEILDCGNLDYYEMHKYETNVNGTFVFRAKKDGVHMVYAVDHQLRLILLRSFRNFSEYGKFLEDKREIGKMIGSV